MKKETFLKLLSLLVTAWLLHGAAFSQSVFDTVMQRIYADIQMKDHSDPREEKAGHYLLTIQGDGSWTDMNYSNPDSKHLDQVLSMARAYTAPGHKYYRNPSMYKAILSSLRFWFASTHRNTNWYFNDIAFPQRLGQVLIVLRHAPSDLPPGLRDTLLKGMNFGAAGHPNTQSGANETDVALHYLYRAVLTRDTAVMDTAYARAYAPVLLVDKEDGLNFDNSFLAHTRQLSIHSYGAVFLDDVLTIAGYLSGTGYGLPEGKLRWMVHFYKDTFIKTGRNGYVDFNTVGRGISRGTGVGHPKMPGFTRPPLLSKILAVAPAYLKETDQIKSLHTHYYDSDYDLDIRPDYTFSIRTVSTRTRRTEQGNGENLLGKFLPDGATNIQRWGGEYHHIFPVWDWDKIPGVTSRDFTDDAGCKMTVNWGEKGTRDFVGGVSDSVYGASAYDMDYNGLRARKSWFFFDREVVCLGAGIRSEAPENITTCVNQCWLYGAATVADTRLSHTVKVNGSASFTNPAWVLHDSIGYFFPVPEKIEVNDSVQSGSWNRINKGQSSQSLSGKVFKLWIEHGTQPKGASYAYIVVPGLTSIAAMRKFPLQDIHIIANDTAKQAVIHKGLDMLQAVFYKAGTLTAPSTVLSVSNPCVLMLKNLHGPTVTLSIADPTQKLDRIKISLQLPGLQGTRQLTCQLPVAPYLGKTAVFTLSNPNSVALLQQGDYQKRGAPGH